MSIKSHNVTWELGISSKSVSVADQGALRAMEFTANLSRPTTQHILETIAKAIMNPIEQENKSIVKPDCIVALETSILSIEERAALAEMLSVFSIKLLDMAELDKFPEYNRARVSAAASSPITPFAIPHAPTGPQEPLPYLATPSRGCVSCKKEILGKASQCSACKAVIYCSVECAVIFIS